MDYQLVRNAQVSVQSRVGSHGTVAHINVNGEFEHTFDSKSRVSKALAVMAPEDLSHRLTGGHYFFVENDLVDFRPGLYHGFVQSDDSIKHLIDTIGITTASDMRKGIRTIKGNTISANYILGKTWSDHGIVVPGYRDGGNFNSQLVFTWNPFMKEVNTFFQLVRLICDNGMVGLANFLNRKIPLINRWEEHLDMANRQIQNKVEAVALRRLAQMGTERASIGELQQVFQHASIRHERALKEDGAHGSALVDRLQRIMRITSPEAHLLGVYRSSVFEDKRLGAQMPGHLTTFDAYNIATELRTHSIETPKSTDLALDRFSNRILFDRKNLIGVGNRSSGPALSSFSDPDAAFFGEMH